MKQSIICGACSIDQRRLFPNDNPYPGEHVKFLPGFALQNYYCDLCAAAIFEGEKCVAFSIWTDRTPYIPWEQVYMKIEEDP
jgi:hypothetical protein